MALTTESLREMKLLLRSLQPEIFRLVFVQHNHRQVIEEVLKQLKASYPKRTINVLRVADQDYKGLTTAIYEQGKGILVIEDFDEILKKPEVFVAFNQRRDKIAQYSLALLCFIPLESEALSELMKKLPDFWSFRNLIVELIQEKTFNTTDTGPSDLEPEISSLGGRTVREKEKELNRLISRVEELQSEPDSTALINTYYPQILRLLEDTGAYRRGLEYAERFLKTIQEDLQQQSATYSVALAWKARFYRYLGHFNEAKNLIEKALLIDTAIYGKTHPIVTTKQNDLALVCEDLGQFEQAKNLFEMVLSSNIKNYGYDHPSVATIQSNLGLVYKRLGMHKEALELLEKSLAFRMQSSDKDNYTTEVALSQSNLATVYHDIGRYEEARELLKKALDADLSNYGETHPTVARRRSKLAMVYRDLGRHEEARKLLEIALASDLRNYGRDHPSTAIRQSDLALVYQNLEDYEQAETLLEDALRTNEAVFGSSHPATVRTQSNLALVYRDLCKYNKAEKLLKEVLSLNVGIYGENHPTVATSQSNLAMVYIDEGKYEKAKKLLRKADLVFSSTLGEDHPYTHGARALLKQLEGR